MSLFIEVYVGSRKSRIKVAEAIAHNESNLADSSDYVFESTEKGAPHLGIPGSINKGEVKNHKRKQSVWRLVEEIVKRS